MNRTETLKQIKEFINDISECLNDIQFDKYQKLLDLTDPEVHHNATQKHLDIFREFLYNNSEAIETMDVTKLNITVITYSENIHIDINLAFEKMKEEHKSIWSHLLVLSSMLVENSNAVEVLTKMNSKGDPMNMILNLVDKVSKNVEVNEDSQIEDVVKNVLSSGIVQDVYKEINTEIQNGNFDISQMMGLVSGLLQQNGNGNGDGVNFTDILGQLNKK